MLELEQTDRGTVGWQARVGGCLVEDCTPVQLLQARPIPTYPDGNQGIGILRRAVGLFLHLTRPPPPRAILVGLRRQLAQVYAVQEPVGGAPCSILTGRPAVFSSLTTVMKCAHELADATAIWES